MKSMFLSAKWEGDVKLNPESLGKMSKFKEIALFASVNFLHRLDVLEDQLKATSNISIVKAKRTKEAAQLLGCDSYENSFDKNIFSECDAILYLGDGNFHPDALLFAQSYLEKKVPVYRWNPVAQILEHLDYSIIENKIKKMKANLLRFTFSKSIGILVTLKPGQENLPKALKLKEKLESEGKEVMIFVDDTFNFAKIEDYNFIDAWVNTACPRIGQDDCVNIIKPIINMKEAFNVNGFLERIN